MKTLLFFILIHFSLLNEDGQQQEKQETPPAGKEEVEFLDQNANQPYLEYLTYDNQFYLDLQRFQQSLFDKKLDLSEQNGHLCPIEYHKSIKLSGIPNPFVKDENIPFCDAMEFNCCTTKDLNVLENFWELFEKKIDLNQQYFKFYITEILKYHEEISRVAKQMSQSSDSHPLCKKVSNLIEKFHIDEEFIQEAEDLLNKALKYDKNLKKGFKCFLCDFDNAPYFDEENKFI